MRQEYWVATGVVVGSVMLLAGMHSGRSSTEEAYQRLISRAGLSFECRQALETAAQDEF